MINIRNSILLALSLICLKSTAQTVVDGKDIEIDTHDMNNLGQQLVIRNKDATLLPSGQYICNYRKRDQTYPILFTINQEGNPDGIVEYKQGFKISVKNGLIWKFIHYQAYDYQPAEEGYMRGDTAVTKYYNKRQELYLEKWRLKGKTICEYSCRTYSTDSISSCYLRDDTRGLSISYQENGKIKSRTVTKNLAKSMRSQTEEFDEHGKLTKKKIEYINGKTKTIFQGGNYTITTSRKGGEEVEEYSKSGKLIRKSTSGYTDIDY